MSGEIGGIDWKLKKIALEFGLQLYVALLLVLIVLIPNQDIIIKNFLSNYINITNLKELYITFIGIYVGWIFISLVDILKKPVIEYKLVPEPVLDGVNFGQLLLNIKIKRRSIINKIFGQADLNKLTASVSIGDKSSSCRWVGNPLPNIFNIPSNRFTYITSFKEDALTVCWIDPKSGKFYLVDEFLFANNDLFNPKQLVSFPNEINIKFFNEGDVYNLTVVYNKSSNDNISF